MSLPINYLNSEEYIKDTLTFLKEYQWIYNFQNTHIIVKDIFRNFPCEWFEYFKNLSNDELNQLPVNSLKNDCPISLKEFLTKANDLKPNIETEHFSEDNIEFTHNCGLSIKKRHEIISLAPVIHGVCQNSDTKLILDVGSGLGYLSHFLNSKYGYKVLGIECSHQFVEMAYKNQEKFYPQTKNEVLFVKHYINLDSVDTIPKLIKTHFKAFNFQTAAIVGLHACADLSVSILDIYSKLDFVKTMVIMPCCYHRMELLSCSQEEDRFLNFPISTKFKKLYKEFEAQKFLRRPFLRLSCQQTIGNFITMSKEEHEKHSKSLMFRCILQHVAESEHYYVTRVKRKSHKISTSDGDKEFELYLNKIHNTHRLIDSNLSEVKFNDNILTKMAEKWKILKENCYLMEVLSGLQTSIQIICENLVLLDRIEYLKEKGFYCHIEKVTNDVLSPRCYALIARKC